MHLDLLSIPQSGGNMLNCSGGIIGCKDKTSSVSHSQRQPEITTLHDGQSRSWSAEQEI